MILTMGIKKLLNKIKKEGKVIKGEATKDKTYSSENKFPTQKDAAREFKRSIEKLFRVNQWSEMPGITSGFQLYNAHGEEKEADRPDLNDYIKIDLPGPAPENWVIITDIKENHHSAEFTVSPSTNPTKKREDQNEIEHFFIEEATSTFKVQLVGRSIYAYEIGKQEGINLS